MSSKSRKKLFKKVTAVLLMVTMLLETGVTEIFAAPEGAGAPAPGLVTLQEREEGAAYGDGTVTGDEGNAAVTGIGTAPEDSGEEEDSYIIGEDPKKRDRFTKHFLTESGSYMAAVYKEPVHYEETAGKWEEIDNTLALSGGSGIDGAHYKNRASDVEVEIARYSDAEKLVSIQSGGGEISWSLVKEGEEDADGTEDGAAPLSGGGSSLFSSLGTNRFLKAVRSGAGVSEFKVRGQEASGQETAGGAAVSRGEAADSIREEKESLAEEETASETASEETAVEGETSAEEPAPEVQSPGEEPMFIPAEGGREGKSAEEYNAEQMALTSLTSGGIYTDILPGVDIEYILDSVNVKENIILKTKAAVKAEFSFRVHHPGMVMALSEDGSVKIEKKDAAAGSGEAEAVTPYTFMAPYMYDSKGETSGKVSYSLMPDGEDTTVLSIRPDPEWLLEEERSYPVTIDPVTETERETKEIVDTYIREARPDEAFNDKGEIAVGHVQQLDYGVCRSLVKFNHLPELEKGDMLYKGVLLLYEKRFSASTAAGFYVTAHRPLSNWDKNVTWSTQPAYDGNALDCQEAVSLGYGEVRAMAFDVTSQARRWYGIEDGNGNLVEENYGILLKSEDEALKAEAYFSTTRNNQAYLEFYPRAIFYYRNAAGLEDYWSYHEQSVGKAGTGYVNDFNGNLVFVHKDFSTVGNVMPVTVSHVYNLCSVDNEQGAAGEVRTKYGNGWSLNVVQKLRPTGIKDFPYVYTDGDGTKHYFYKDTEDGDKIKDEDGLGLTVTKTAQNTEDSSIVICKDKSEMTFNYWGDLTGIKDTNGNQIEYGYDTNRDGHNNHLVYVKDGNGEKVVFSYDQSSWRLEKITDLDNGREMTFGYDGSGNLVSITHPDGTVTTYVYYGKLLTQAKEPLPEKYTIGYGYHTDMKVPRVCAVQEYGWQGGTGRRIEIEYRNGTTTLFRYPGPSGAIQYQDEADRLYYYDFDTSGRNLTVRDEKGAASSYAYYKDGANNNKLRENGSLRKTVHNYLGNAGVEADGPIRTEENLWTDLKSGSDVVEWRKDTGYSGSTSVYVRRSSGTGKTGIFQDVEGLKCCPAN